MLAILQGIAQVAFDASYRFLTWQTNYIETHEQLALDALAQQEIDALIIVSHSLPLSAILPYERYGPIVFCEHHEDVAPFISITIRLFNKDSYICDNKDIQVSGFVSGALTVRIA
ncbi:hypothetical protein OVA29_01225 [Exiguobacterium sp. SL14]|nr:hypothetical protein [Exiguobacterium sp. SL14]MCY1689645.1 hypothetical protein [Exiguobacterium sp. SL14]